MLTAELAMSNHLSLRTFFAQLPQAYSLCDETLGNEIESCVHVCVCVCVCVSVCVSVCVCV